MAHYANTVLPHEYRCPHTSAELRPLWCDKCGSLVQCVALYKSFKTAYYVGRPLVTDDQFDNYEANCRRRFPDEQTFHSVGQQV
jgi:hypothetical protein